MRFSLHPSDLVAEELHEALTVRQRKWMKPRDRVERSVALKIARWTGTIMALLILTPINMLVWFALDMTVATVSCVCYAIWWRRRTPRLLRSQAA